MQVASPCNREFLKSGVRVRQRSAVEVAGCRQGGRRVFESLGPSAISMKGYAFGLVGLLIAVAFQLYVKDNRRKQEELALKPSIKLDDRAYVDRLKLEDMLLREPPPTFASDEVQQHH